MVSRKTEYQGDTRRERLGAFIAVGVELYGILNRHAERRQIKEVHHRGAVDGHGRTADRPSEIPPRGWWDVVTRVKGDIRRPTRPSLPKGGLRSIASDPLRTPRARLALRTSLHCRGCRNPDRQHGRHPPERGCHAS